MIAKYSKRKMNESVIGSLHIRIFINLAATSAVKGIRSYDFSILIESFEVLPTYCFRFTFQKRVYRHKKEAHNYFARPIKEILSAADAMSSTDVAHDTNTGVDVSTSILNTCQICDTVLSSSHQFHDHMKIHVDKESYICNICGKRFKKPSALKVV